MATVVRLKRSAVPGKVPDLEDLNLGEIAVNTYDGKLYLKKSVGGVESVVTIGEGGGGGGPVGDYVAHITAGTGVSVTGPTGSASEITVSIGQSVGTTDTVAFSKMLLGSSNPYTGYENSIPDGSIVTGLGGAVIFQDQTFQFTRAPRLFTDGQVVLNVVGVINNANELPLPYDGKIGDGYFNLGTSSYSGWDGYQWIDNLPFIDDLLPGDMVYFDSTHQINVVIGYNGVRKDITVYGT